jgi:hypothetical protein
MNGGFGFPLGSAAAAAATVLTIAEDATGHHGYSVGALLLVVAATAFMTTPWAAAGVVAVAWALHTGFVLGRFGQLVFTRESAWAATLFVAAALVGAAVGAATRSNSRSDRCDGIPRRRQSPRSARRRSASPPRPTAAHHAASAARSPLSEGRTRPARRPVHR